MEVSEFFLWVGIAYVVVAIQYSGTLFGRWIDEYPKCANVICLGMTLLMIGLCLFGIGVIIKDVTK